MQKRRYPLTPIVNIILKIVAVAALLFLGILAIVQYAGAIHTWFHASQQASMYGMMPVPKVTGFKPRMMSLINPTLMLFLGLALSSLTWAVSDIATAAREIEFRTRKALANPEAAKSATEESVSA